MDWFLENWFLVIGAIALLVAIGVAVYKFLGLPTKEQFIKIKKMLLYWVALAEQKYGGGTGQIKLRYVYDLFSSKFPFIAKLITFEKFSKLVDDALDELAELLKVNEKVSDIITPSFSGWISGSTITGGTIINNISEIK